MSRTREEAQLRMVRLAPVAQNNKFCVVHLGKLGARMLHIEIVLLHIERSTLFRRFTGPNGRHF
eukprot:5470052-Prymnesium_polylepis.1